MEVTQNSFEEHGLGLNDINCERCKSILKIHSDDLLYTTSKNTSNLSYPYNWIFVKCVVCKNKIYLGHSCSDDRVEKLKFHSVAHFIKAIDVAKQNTETIKTLKTLEETRTKLKKKRDAALNDCSTIRYRLEKDLAELDRLEEGMELKK